MSTSRERVRRGVVARLAAAAVQTVLHAGLLASLPAVMAPDERATPPEQHRVAPRPSVPPVLIGSVARLDTRAFVAATYAGERTVHIDVSTGVVTGVAPATFAALRPGYGVIVWGERLPDGSVLARSILVGAAP